MRKQVRAQQHAGAALCNGAICYSTKKTKEEEANGRGGEFEQGSGQLQVDVRVVGLSHGSRELQQAP
jgi:hypothetical protein